MSVDGILDRESDPRLEQKAQRYLENIQAERGRVWLDRNRRSLREEWEFAKAFYVTDGDLEAEEADSEGREQDSGPVGEGDED